LRRDCPPLESCSMAGRGSSTIRAAIPNYPNGGGMEGSFWRKSGRRRDVAACRRPPWGAASPVSTPAFRLVVSGARSSTVTRVWCSDLAPSRIPARRTRGTSGVASRLMLARALRLVLLFPRGEDAVGDYTRPGAVLDQCQCTCTSLRIASSRATTRRTHGCVSHLVEAVWCEMSDDPRGRLGRHCGCARRRPNHLSGATLCRRGLYAYVREAVSRRASR
jgi:hypothetical protein